MRKAVFVLGLALVLSACVVACARAADGLAISNEFIKIRVNPGPQEAGRFAIDTTGGDPSRPADDNQPLIYGSTEPWTTYTTVSVDGKPVLFGGPTVRRAGKGVASATLEQAPHVENGVISTSCRIGDIVITQQLSFMRSQMTRVNDAARIAYVVANRGQTPHIVGVRLVLDTMLGKNDGAPLRAGDKAIATATQLVGEAIPDYWQAFDSISNPTVISQGTLRGPGLTPPNRLAFCDWGHLADNPWDFAFPTGADFTRAGEDEKDTAVGLYWDPEPLAPGASRTYATAYGLGGVTLSPAQLSLGLTAPAEVDYQYRDTRSFAVVAYLENSGGYDAQNVSCTLTLPKGLKLQQGGATTSFGLVKSKETRQAAWRVMPTGEASGPLKLAVSVTSSNLEPNRVEREVIVNSPPQLDLQMSAPAALTVTKENRYAQNPFQVKVTAKNTGAQVAQNVVLIASLPEGLQLADGAAATRVLARLGANKSKQFTWSVLASGMPSGSLPVTVKASAAGAKPVQTSRLVDIPRLTPELRVYPAQQVVPATTDNRPTLVPIDVVLTPARDFAGAQVSLTYDPSVLEPLYVSRGEAFVAGGRLLAPWSDGQVEEGVIAGVGGRRTDAPVLNVPEVQLFRVVFMVKGPGTSALGFASTAVTGSDGKDMVHRTVAGHVTVR